MQFLSFTGIVTDIHQMDVGLHSGMANCMQLFTVEGAQGEITNFLISPDTYFVHHEVIRKGDRVTGYYDANAPVPLIYPPQFRAIVIAKETDQYFVKVSRFNQNLLSEDGQLQLNMARTTKVSLENNQPFQGDLRNRDLIVLYGPTTRSIPAQTTPYEVVVLCSGN